MTGMILIRWYLNFSTCKLSDYEKSLFSTGLHFSEKPKLIEFSEYLRPFELLLQEIKQENLCSEGLSLLKARLLDKAFSWHQSFSNDQSPSANSTSSELQALR